MFFVSVPCLHSLANGKIVIKISNGNKNFPIASSLGYNALESNISEKQGKLISVTFENYNIFKRVYITYTCYIQLLIRILRNNLLVNIKILSSSVSWPSINPFSNDAKPNKVRRVFFFKPLELSFLLTKNLFNVI